MLDGYFLDSCGSRGLLFCARGRGGRHIASRRQAIIRTGWVGRRQYDVDFGPDNAVRDETITNPS